MPSRRSSAVVILVLALLPLVLTAQTNAPASAQPPAPSAPNQNTPYTFHSDTRVVLTDVTVTDSKGNPVHGLPQSAFRIFDNNQPQAIGSFEEHTRPAQPANPPAVVPVAAHGVYSNDYLEHLPPSVSVLVLDTTNLDIPDQMYLVYELGRFFKAFPEDQPLAIYVRIESGCFLLQNFTTDRRLLDAAVRRALPRFPPNNREYISDIATLHELAVHLNQVPGRKSILWFTGGSTLFLREDATVFQNEAAWRNLYDELEQERVAVYPIDARGLTLRSGPAMWDQHFLMNEVAGATGGHAFYNTNGLTEAAAHITDTDRSYYTLTYSPRNFRFDNKWHKVRIALDEGHYQLSYRSGYFADGSHPGAQPQPRSRTHLLSNGEKVEEPQLRSLPIVFEARVLPASDPAIAAQPIVSGAMPPPVQPSKRGSVPYVVRYTVPASSLNQHSVDGKMKVSFEIAAFSFNNYGSAVEKNADRVTMTLDSNVLRVNPGSPLFVDQQLNLPRGQNFLYLALWDTTSGRVGTLQIPLQVEKPPKGAPNSVSH